MIKIVADRPNAHGAYVITTAEWPRADRFTQDRHALFSQMRREFAARPLVPFVHLRGDA